MSENASESLSASGQRVAESQQSIRSWFWRSNLRLVIGLMLLWAFFSFGCGIFFSAWLDQWMLPFTEMPLGFFMAQQGSIYGFLVLIGLYIWRMNLLERRFRARMEKREQAIEPERDLASQG